MSHEHEIKIGTSIRHNDSGIVGTVIGCTVDHILIEFEHRGQTLIRTCPNVGRKLFEQLVADYTIIGELNRLDILSGVR